MTYPNRKTPRYCFRPREKGRAMEPKGSLRFWLARLLVVHALVAVLLLVLQQIGPPVRHGVVQGSPELSRHPEGSQDGNQDESRRAESGQADHPHHQADEADCPEDRHDDGPAGAETGIPGPSRRNCPLKGERLGVWPQLFPQTCCQHCLSFHVAGC